MSESSPVVGPRLPATPVRFGVVLGALLGGLERFLIDFELPTLAAGFLVLGVVLARFGGPSRADVGWALAAAGAASFPVLRALLVVFG